MIVCPLLLNFVKRSKTAFPDVESSAPVGYVQLVQHYKPPEKLLSFGGLFLSLF